MTQLSQYISVAEAISLLYYPHAEVILHDLSSGVIAALFNNFSKREIGDESLLEGVNDFSEFPDIFPAYLKTNWDGRKIKSISATLRDPEGKAIGLLCINLDLTKWAELHNFLGSWLTNMTQSQPEILFKDDWREKINCYVSDYLTRMGTTLKLLNKDKKKALVLALHKEGAFKAKNAANYVADVLDLSRATIYNYLKVNNDD
ncbi:MAG: PAS domain-containing protein [Parachlamydiaceae bacterium]|nr:PAS domain-containing protein [Parachlamydiaceae bacterium]